MHGVVSYKFEYKLENEADYKLGKEIDSSKNSCNYTYIDLTQEVVNNLKVSVTDHKGNIKESTLDVTPDIRQPMNPNVDGTLAGKVVNYTPKAGQVYNTENGDWTESKKDSTNYPEYSGAGFQYFTSGSNGNNGDYTGTWSVWGLDNNYIYIVSTKPTAKKFGLHQALGYNNGVTLLDTLCDTCFSNKTVYPGSIGQNLKKNQIIAILPEAVRYIGQYYGKIGPLYTWKRYPHIWYEHEQTFESAIQNQSTAFRLTMKTFTDEIPSEGPHDTADYGATGWLNEKEEIPKAYRDLLCTGGLDGYWLSTRAVTNRSNSEYTGFGISIFDTLNKNIQSVVTLTTIMYWEQVTQPIRNYPVRPIISFPRSMYELEEQADGSYNIVSKQS